jgi:hypothetical protein
VIVGWKDDWDEEKGIRCWESWWLVVFCQLL